MAEPSESEKANKLKAFIAETSADENVAAYYLQSETWDVERAVAGFKELKLAEERRIESRAAVVGKDRPRTASEAKTRRERVGPLRRGMSMANTELVANVREKMVSSELTDRLDRSFVLPNITTVKEPDLVQFLKNDLIDKATYQSLTNAEVLNWWAEPKVSACRKLFPMSTVGDGNCLLHAVSLAMWGFHDRLLTLRKLLYKFLTDVSATGSLKRRWMYQQWKLNMDAGGLCFTQQEWEDEWAAMVRLASDKPRSQNKVKTASRRISKQYSIAVSSNCDDSLKRTDSQGSDSFESLEEFHVFALAHVLLRPIIVVSDVMLRDLEGEPLQPIHFGGIYLPIECDPRLCCKYPVVLGYDSGHFAALVPAEGEDVAANKSPLLSSIPLTRFNLELLQLQFSVDPGAVWTLTVDDSKKTTLPEMCKQEKLATLSKYLHVTKVDQSTKGSSFISGFQNNGVSECELAASDVGNFCKKKSKEGKPFVAKAFENITTLVTGHSSFSKTSPRLQRNTPEKVLFTAKLNVSNRPEYFDEMVQNYITSSRKKLNERKSGLRQSSSSGRIQCATPGCSYYGSSDTNYLCSKCYKYQRDITKVHKSLPSLQDVRPPLLKIANRQLSNPEKIEADDSLISFENYDQFRPATAPPQDVVEISQSSGSNASFDSMIDTILFSNQRRLSPSAPFPTFHQSTEEHASTVRAISPARVNASSSNAPVARIDDFDPLKTSAAEVGGIFPVGRICKREGCKIFGTSEFDGFCYSCFNRLYSKAGFV